MLIDLQYKTESKSFLVHRRLSHLKADLLTLKAINHLNSLKPKAIASC